MSKLFIIIPSKSASNLKVCLAAARECEPEAHIIIIDDGIGPDLDPHSFGFANAIVPGIQPFCFPRNCNLGIVQAGNGDVVLLNDDAVLKTQYGFTLLQAEAEHHSEFGIIAATTNIAGNRDQFPKGIGLRETDRGLAFVCVFIPRRTIDCVGLMDERFGGNTPDGKRIYGFCDQDYTRRIRLAGLKIGVHDGCFVDHGSLRSSFRGDPRAGGDISAGRELYVAKWGDLS